MLGALFFDWLTDRLGGKKLFFITITVYLSATALTGLAWKGFTFFLFRFTGAGIGGEYAAINSTIQKLFPARFRGHLDLMINGSFWVGATLGALVAVALLNPSLVDPELGSRLAFLTGAANARIDEPLLDCRDRRLPFPWRPWIASQRLLQYSALASPKVANG